LATVFERVKKIAITKLRLQENEIFADSNFASDLGADSLDHVELMIAFEEEFSSPGNKISIPDEESEKMLTVQDAVDYLHSIGVSDVQPIPKQAEKSGFPRINLHRPHLPKPGFAKPGQPKPDKPDQSISAGGLNQPGSGEHRRDIRQHRRERHSNQPKQNFNQKPQQHPAAPPPSQASSASPKQSGELPETGAHRPDSA